MIKVDPGTEGFVWTVLHDDAPIARSAEPFPTRAEATSNALRFYPDASVEVL